MSMILKIDSEILFTYNLFKIFSIQLNFFFVLEYLIHSSVLVWWIFYQKKKSEGHGESLKHYFFHYLNEDMCTFNFIIK